MSCARNILASKTDLYRAWRGGKECTSNYNVGIMKVTNRESTEYYGSTWAGS